MSINYQWKRALLSRQFGLNSCFLDGTVAFQLRLANSGELGITNCLQGWEGGKQTPHRGWEAPGPPQPGTHRAVDVSGVRGGGTTKLSRQW